MIYENNSELSESEKQRLEESDLSQKQAVLQVLGWAAKPLTDSEFRDNAIAEGLISPNTPLTSIRRARSNLKNEGKVVEGATKRDGGYGVKTKTWREASSGEQADAFGTPKSKHKNAIHL